jgi:hypothetical protein
MLAAETIRVPRPAAGIMTTTFIGAASIRGSKAGFQIIGLTSLAIFAITFAPFAVKIF